MTWQDLIDRARFYLDDDHAEDEGWISPARALSLLNVEYRQQYRRWVRSGLITPAHTVASFTGSTVNITDVLCVVGVAENLGVGTPPRLLVPGDQRWDAALTGKSEEWTATGAADDLAITLWPVDAGATYIVRHIERPALIEDVEDDAELPDGADERIALGFARRAMIKESAASRRLDAEILDADAELNMTAWGRRDGDSPRVRRINQQSVQRGFPVEPYRWIYF